MTASPAPTRGPIRLIEPDGSANARDEWSLPSEDALLGHYRSMVLSRRINDQAGALVRQGMLAVYPSSHGQEACQIAAAAVLAPKDWLFPTYRDMVAVIERGVDPLEAMVSVRGDWHCGYDPNEHHVAPQATPLATQLLHAVGVGYAARLRGEETVVLALCGDGATSEGDFHEALNFAAVFAVPVVFLIQNNKYAISVPLSRQTAARTLADKGIGYGMPSALVDGNDVAALTVVLSEAVERARAGGGPTLVEADTYRMQAHTNADDATRYREDDEVAAWRDRDPLKRLRTYLVNQGLLDEAREAEISGAAEELAGRIRAGISTTAPTAPDELFQHVYAELPPQLREQRELLREEITAAAGDAS